MDISLLDQPPAPFVLYRSVILVYRQENHASANRNRCYYGKNRQTFHFKHSKQASILVSRVEYILTNGHRNDNKRIRRVFDCISDGSKILARFVDVVSRGLQITVLIDLVHPHRINGSIARNGYVFRRFAVRLKRPPHKDVTELMRVSVQKYYFPLLGYLNRLLRCPALTVEHDIAWCGIPVLLRHYGRYAHDKRNKGGHKDYCSTRNHASIYARMNINMLE